MVIKGEELGEGKDWELWIATDGQQGPVIQLREIYSIFYDNIYGNGYVYVYIYIYTIHIYICMKHLALQEKLIHCKSSSTKILEKKSCINFSLYVAKI